MGWAWNELRTRHLPQTDEYDLQNEYHQRVYIQPNRENPQGKFCTALVTIVNQYDVVRKHWVYLSEGHQLTQVGYLVWNRITCMFLAFNTAGRLLGWVGDNFVDAADGLLSAAGISPGKALLTMSELEGAEGYGEF